MKPGKWIALFFNIICLALSIIWCVKSGYDWEPLIAIITFIATLIPIIFVKGKPDKTDDEKESRNISKIKGDNITVNQKIDKSERITVHESGSVHNEYHQKAKTIINAQNYTENN